MSIPNAGRRKIRPTHPGAMLREDFLPEYGLTVSALAEALGVSRQTMSELLRERRAVGPEMALRLSRLFSNSPEFWLNAQRAVDLWDAAKALKGRVERIKPLRVRAAMALRIKAGDPEFAATMNTAERFLNRYRNALRNLAK